MIVGTVLVGAAQPFFQCTPALLAANWFGPDERTLATTIARTLRDGGEGAVLYLAHEPRKPDVERAFFELLGRNGGF